MHSNKNCSYQCISRILTIDFQCKKSSFTVCFIRKIQSAVTYVIYKRRSVRLMVVRGGQILIQICPILDGRWLRLTGGSLNSGENALETLGRNWKRSFKVGSC